jgi:hypothetical protein
MDGRRPLDVTLLYKILAVCLYVEDKIPWVFVYDIRYAKTKRNEYGRVMIRCRCEARRGDSNRNNLADAA